MPRGKARAIVVGARRALAVDWIALTIGICGAGLAIIAVLLMLDQSPEGTPDCATTGAVCPE